MSRDLDQARLDELLRFYRSIAPSASKSASETLGLMTRRIDAVFRPRYAARPRGEVGHCSAVEETNHAVECRSPAKPLHEHVIDEVVVGQEVDGPGFKVGARPAPIFIRRGRPESTWASSSSSGTLCSTSRSGRLRPR